MQNSYNNQGAEYAGFWVRLAAYCIDSAIVWFGLLFVRLIIGVVSLSGGDVFQARVLFQYTLKDIVLYVAQVSYFILLTYYTGTTLGKRVLNLRVVPADESLQLSFLDVSYRETVGRFLCGLSIGIGYIMVGIDKEKRGLHDMLCDTRVIYGKRVKIYPVYPMPPMSGPMSRPPQSPAQGPGMPPYGAGPVQGPGKPPYGTGPAQGPGMPSYGAGPVQGPGKPPYRTSPAQDPGEASSQESHAKSEEK